MEETLSVKLCQRKLSGLGDADRRLSTLRNEPRDRGQPAPLRGALNPSSDEAGGGPVG